MTKEDLRDESRTQIIQKTIAEEELMHTQGLGIQKFRVKNKVKDKARMDTNQLASKGWDQDELRLEG